MNTQYLIKQYGGSFRQVCVCAKHRTEALQILLMICGHNNTDIEVLDELNSGSHTRYKVYLNDGKNTVMEFLVTG